MCEKEVKYPNRLRELVDRETPSISKKEDKIEAFAEKHNLGVETLKSYYYEQRPLTMENAILFADYYGITVDWLICRSSVLYDGDVMADIILALSKVFKFNNSGKTRKSKGKLVQFRNNELYIENQFFNFLNDIKSLDYKKYIDKINNKIVSDDEYQAERIEIYSKYREYFKEIFNLHGFNKKMAKRIDSIDIFNILP